MDYKCVSTERVVVKDNRGKDVIIYSGVIYSVKKGYNDFVLVNGRFGGFYKNGNEYSVVETRFIGKQDCKKYFRYL